MFLFRNSLPRIKGYIRFIHATPDAPNIDVYLNDNLIYSDLSFGTVTTYIPAAPETYSIKLFKSGTRISPLITESLQVLPNSVSTINITFENNEIAFFSLDDTHGTSNKRLSYVRFINVAPTAPLLSLSLPNDTTLFDEASYLETNDYYPISPGIYNFIVSTSDSNLSKYISDVNLSENLYITIYIIGLYNQKPPLGYILLKDGINNLK